jgi:hypothetical protein
VSAPQVIGQRVEAPLKGDRTYLHSTDLWTSLEGLFRKDRPEPGRRMMITFRRFTNRAPLLVELQGASADRFADVRISDAAGIRDYCLVDSETEVTTRVTCPERTLGPAIEIDGLTASVVVPDFATPLETLVAATKKLHLAAIQPDVKWVVGRLDLPLPFPARAGDRIAVTITHRLPRQSTVSAIAVDGRPAGTVMFNILR